MKGTDGLGSLRRRKLIETVEREGWNDGVVTFLLSLRGPARRDAFRRLFADVSGLQFLVSHRDLKRVLCVDGLPAATALAMAPICEELTVGHTDPAELRAVRRRLDARGATSVATREIVEGGALPWPDGHFDAVILLASPSVSLEETHRVLSPRGFVCRRSTRRDGVSARRARSLGFDRAVVRPLLVDRGVVREVCLAGTNPSAVSGRGARAAMKRLLLRGPLGRIAAPESVLVAGKGEPRPTFLDDLLDRLGGGKIRWYRVLFSKVILSVGDPRASHGERIVVLPLTPWVNERRKHEARMLDALQTLPAVAPVVPKSVAQGSLHGSPYHVLTEIPGFAIDTDGPFLEAATGMAAAWLGEFHEGTSNRQRIGDEVFERLFGAPIDRVGEVFPETREAVARVRAELRERVIGKLIPTVWSHGDFKIENVLFDRSDRRIRGVIDWDLADREGLPLLDVLYLVAYNREIRRDESLHDVFFGSILRDDLEPDEAALVSRYVDRIGIEESLLDPLRVMFWVHHLTRRLHVSDTGARVLEWLGSTPGRLDAHLRVGGERVHGV